ncbi:MAG: acyl-CoA dehydrogenase, partial [Proteobacteria bacterium]|nr:acyl-CoA dehydrogenase [Pseudomonadota bacterium]
MGGASKTRLVRLPAQEGRDVEQILVELGAAAAPGPFFSTAVVGAHAISAHGNDDQKSKYLPRLVSGELITSLAILEGGASWEAGGIRMSARRSEDGWRLNGEKVFVADAGVADLFIVAARTGENGPPEESITLFLIEASTTENIEMERLESVADDRYYVVDFQDVVVPPDGVLGEVAGGWPLLKQTLDLAAVAKCAEMVGGSRRAVDMTLEYVKERVQFG